MRGLFKRWRRGAGPQTAEGATAGRDINMFSNIEGPVYVGIEPPPPPPEFDAAVAHYTARLRQRYGRLDLEVLTPLREQGEHPVVPLHDVFVPQSVRADPPPVELPRELLRRLEDPTEAEFHELPPGVDRETVERVREAYRQRPPQPVLDVLSAPDNDHVVLLGDPGAGKSTLSRYLALALTAPEPVPGLERLHGRLPLILELRGYAQAAWRERSFEDYLAHQYETEGLGLPAELLTAVLAGEAPRKPLVIFDGLDELFETDVRDAVTRRIAGFAARHPEARVLVTSRGHGYQRAVLDGAGFADFMLQDLDREQIGAFVAQWFAVACPEDPEGARRLIERVTSAVDGSRSVRELAGNPLILTILAIIGRRRELPRDRRRVYQHAVDVLVEHWDPSKYLKDRRIEEHLPYLSADDKLELLRLIARGMQTGQGGVAGNHIAGPDLITYFEDYLKDRYALPPDRAATAARLMLDQFRHRNFILSRFGGEIYGFVHRAFLEYLTATDLAHRFHRTRELSEQDLQDLFETKVHDPAWQEILLLLVGMLDERFVAGVMDRLLAPRPVSIRLAANDDRAFAEVTFLARCLGEVRRLNVLEPQSRSLVRRITRLFDQAAVLGRRFYYPSRHLDDLGPALRALGGDWCGRADYLEWFEGDRPHQQPLGGRRLAANSLGQLAADVYLCLASAGTDTSWADVAQSALASDRREVRIGMAWRLLRRTREEPALRPLVERCVREDPSPAVRQTLLEYLSFEPTTDPDWVGRLALERMDREEDARVRAAAVELLQKDRVADPEVRAALERALQDRAAEVRRAALRGLISDPDRSRSMAACRVALSEGNGEIRRIAFSAARDNGLDADEEFQALIENMVRNDVDAEVLPDAIGALGPRALERAAVHELLLARSAHDDPGVRAAAVRRMARSGSRYEALVTRVSHLMDHDEDRYVRRAALYAFGRFEEQTARALLVERTRGADGPWTRLDAWHTLFRLDRGLARRLIAERLRTEPDEPVRMWMISELRRSDGRGALVDADAEYAVLLDLAASDPSGKVRRPAFEQLAEFHDDVPALLALAEDRYAHDPDDTIRAHAFTLLTDIRRDDPALIPVLRHAAEHESDPIAARATSLLAVLAPEGRRDPT
ncbi:HEAT repeat domain-containing protein [Streptomyces sp. NPDC006339]|uniref:HEAT repeat domain-containing protein n=1 Tax=Streptomyces sp. NPDC006339 TaxID=3156755 RepID=UPI0033AD3A4C